MAGIVKIDEEVFSTEDFIRVLKLNGRFESIMEDILKDQLMVRAAKKLGVKLTDEEIQERADQFRRVHELHRAKDTNEYFDALGVSLEDFEAFLVEELLKEKVMEQIARDEVVEEFFQLNSPRFESIEVSHIVMDSEGGAREMLSVLEDDPESFEEMAREHSIEDTAEEGGRIGKLLRGTLDNEVEAKVFNAEAGELLGPFGEDDGERFEIFRVDAKNTASLDDDTRKEIVRMAKDEWLAARAREHKIEIL